MDFIYNKQNMEAHTFSKPYSTQKKNRQFFFAFIWEKHVVGLVFMCRYYAEIILKNDFSWFRAVMKNNYFHTRLKHNKKKWWFYFLFVLVRTTTKSIQFINKPVFLFSFFPCCYFAFISKQQQQKNRHFIYDLCHLRRLP
jgi:hypothetical protein